MKTAARAAWDGGWLRAARALPSPNHGPRPPGAEVDLLVLHSISLPPGEYGGGQVQQLFTNRLDWDAHPYFRSVRGLRVSSHFFIERTGQLWQFVDVRRRAWHAGRSHYRGRGSCNDDSIGIELEGLEGLAFEERQYAALLELCTALLARHPVRFVAGHEHIAPARKHDPGAGFDWPLLTRPLAGRGVLFPPGI